MNRLLFAKTSRFRIVKTEVTFLFSFLFYVILYLQTKKTIFVL